MRNLALSIALVTSLIAAAGANAAAPHRLCVGSAEGCYANIQPAVDAAHDGDTIAVGQGTFAGGVTIDKSIRLDGAGAQATRIVGGGPVLTLGAFDATVEPRISVDGVTIAGGRTTSSPDGGWIARGGGVFIPPAADSNVGATVTITDTIIARNETAPSTTFPSPSGAHCPDGDCPYAEADGGGIDNWGTLTLDRVAVVHNRSAGPVTSDADGGGIYSHQGALTIRRSAIDDNSAVAVPPNARFAEGGGIFVREGTLRIDASSLNGNTASLTSTFPSFAGDDLISMNAHAGALHADDGVPTTVEDTTIADNRVSAFDPNGEPAGFDSAMFIGDSPLTMRRVVFSGNAVRATYASSEDVGIGGATLEVDGGGRITDTRITDNYASAVSRDGVAAVANGLNVFNFSDHEPERLVVTDTVIERNHAVARSSNGTAIV